jgi:hypothetical protein
MRKSALFLVAKSNICGKDLKVEYIVGTIWVVCSLTG